jgi:glycosyltransferase involved in cell wall biosynthesis
MTLKILIIAGDYFPPCSGSSERIWQLIKEITRLRCKVTLSIHLWRDFRVEDFRNVNIIPLPRWRFRIWEIFKWIKQVIKSGRHNILQVELFQPLRTIIIRVIFHLWAEKFVLIIHDLSWLYDVAKARGLCKIIKHFLVILNFYLYDMVIFVSKDLERYLCHHYDKVLKNKIAILPSGIPKFSTSSSQGPAIIREKLRLPKDHFIVAFFGPLHASFNREAVSYLYSIAEYVAQRFKEITGKNLLFVIAGRGTEKLKNLQFIRSLGFIENIFDLLTAVDACIVPHKPSYTGPHIKAIYALAAGCPLLTTSDGIKGLYELGLKKNVHYMLFNINDVNTLIEALIKLEKNYELRRRTAIETKFLVARYTWENIAKEYIKLLLEVLRR